MGIRLDRSVWLVSSLLEEMDGLWRTMVASLPMSLHPGGCTFVLPSSSSSDLSVAVPGKLRSDRAPGLDLSTLQGVVSGSFPLEGLVSLVVCSTLEDGQDRDSEDRVLRVLYVLHRGSSVSPVDAPVTETTPAPNNQSYTRKNCIWDILWVMNRFNYEICKFCIKNISLNCSRFR